MIQGLKPGVEMLTDHLDLTFSMVWTIVVANLLAAGVLMIWSKQVAKVAFVPSHLLVPGVLATVFMGAWLGGASLGTWVSCLGAGLLGYMMKQSDWPRPPLILALVLGPIMENAFQISMRVHAGVEWLARPIVIAIAVLIGLTIFLAWKNHSRMERSEQPENGTGGDDRREAGSAVISVVFALCLAIVFVAAGINALPWPASVRQFPIAIVIAGVAFTSVVLMRETHALRRMVSVDGLASIVAGTANRLILPKSLEFFGFLVGLVVVMPWIGQKLALPLFVVAYLWWWSDFGWRTITIYALATWTVLIVFYEMVLHVFWYPAAAWFWLSDALPSWFPLWLVV